MTLSREHFPLETLADFSRERVSGEARAAIERHLAEGCPRCTEVVKLWNTVVELAQREPAFEPPEDAVRCAKALYGAMPSLKSPPFRLRLAHLAGFGMPALEGVRGAGPAANHFLFREGTLLLDMYIHTQDPSGVVSMVGQLLDSTHPDRRFENQPVAVFRKRDALAHTTTNEFGEFHLEFQPGEDLLLTIELDDQSYVVSPLPPPRQK